MPAGKSPTPLVVITGHAGTGKTTLAGKLGAELSMPVLSKDNIKVQQMAGRDVRSVQVSSVFGAEAWTLMFAAARQHLKSRAGVIIEGPFDPDRGTDQINRLGAKTVVEIFCTCALELTLQRFAGRARHDGLFDRFHVDHPNQWLIPGHARSRPLGVGQLLVVRTDDFTSVDPVEIATRVREAVDREVRMRDGRTMGVLE